MNRLISSQDLCIYAVAAALECRSARRADFPYLPYSSPSTPLSSVFPSFYTPIPFQKTMFDARTGPLVSILEYVTRIAEGAKASTCVYVTALLYMQLLANASPNYAPSPYNVHRLFITAVTLAVKWHDDIFYSNAYYAALGGISTTELNRLELIFLTAINFKCALTDSDLMLAEYIVISEACEACMGPAVLPELEQAGIWVPHSHLAELDAASPPYTPVPTAMYMPPSPPIFPDLDAVLFPDRENNVGQCALADAHLPSCCASGAPVPCASMPGFDSFAGVFLAPCCEQTAESEEESYECHAVRMLDIEYGSAIGTFV